jgi:hypothetical protein
MTDCGRRLAGVFSSGAGRAWLLEFVVAILASLVFSSAALAATLTWPVSLQASNEVAAASTASTDPYGDPSTSTSGLTCWSAADCVAVGNDGNAAGGIEPIVIPITSGLPGAAVAASLPTGAAAYSGGDQLADLDAVSCQPSGDCVAVGYYDDGSEYQQPLVVPIVDGVPGKPAEVSPPGEITTSNPRAELFSVSCPATGACLAAGSYRDGMGHEQAFVVPVSGGVAQVSREVNLPAGDQYDPYNNSSATGPYVGCWASDSCVLAGQYLDTDRNDHEFVSEVTGGVPSAAVDVTLPNDAQADDLDGDQLGGIFGLSCATSGDCAAVGYYTNSDGVGNEPLVVSISDGQPNAASTVTLPIGARTEAQAQFAHLFAVDCPAFGACVAVGDYVAYTNPDDHNSDLPLVVEISASGATSFDPSLPAGAASAAADGGDQLDSVSCPVAGSCVATGLYETATPDQRGFLVPVSGDQVEAGQELTLPSDGSSSWGQPWVGCASSGACAVSEEYLDTSNNTEGYVEGLQTPLAISTTSLSAGRIGSEYSQQLTATGAWGSYTWSVSSGSLPAGLSLNAETGVISGTPTAGGISTFTVEAKGTGNPAQAATQSLTLNLTGPVAALIPVLKSVTPQPVPSLKVALAHTGLVTSGKVTAEIGCVTASCGGELEFVHSRRVKLEHGRHKLLTTVIGQTAYSVAAGGSGSVKLTLNAAGRRLLSVAPHQRLVVTVHASLSGGSSASLLTSIHLRALTTKRS